MQAKELPKEIINDANMVSMNGCGGDSINEEYKQTIKDLKDLGREDLFDEAYSLFSRVLSRCSDWVSPAVAGRSNYNYKKFNRVFSSLEKSERELGEFLDKVKALKEEKAKRDAGIDPESEHAKKIFRECYITLTTMSINKSLCYESLLELSKVDEKGFKRLYNAYDKARGINKRSKVYKRYHELFD